jgi:hypothetical protein
VAATGTEPVLAFEFTSYWTFVMEMVNVPPDVLNVPELVKLTSTTLGVSEPHGVVEASVADTVGATLTPDEFVTDTLGVVAKYVVHDVDGPTVMTKSSPLAQPLGLLDVLVPLTVRFQLAAAWLLLPMARFGTGGTAASVAELGSPGGAAGSVALDTPLAGAKTAISSAVAVPGGRSEVELSTTPYTSRVPVALVVLYATFDRVIVAPCTGVEVIWI